MCFCTDHHLPFRSCACTGPASRTRGCGGCKPSTTCHARLSQKANQKKKETINKLLPSCPPPLLLHVFLSWCSCLPLPHKEVGSFQKRNETFARGVCSVRIILGYKSTKSVGDDRWRGKREKSGLNDKTLLLTVAFHYLQSHYRNNMPRTPATKSSKASKEGPTHPSYEKVSNQASYSLLWCRFR